MVTLYLINSIRGSIACSLLTFKGFCNHRPTMARQEFSDEGKDQSTQYSHEVQEHVGPRHTD